MTSLLTHHRSRGAVAAFISSALAFGGGVAMLGAESGSASSHREAPQILADPQVDNTDVYAFVSPDRQGKVTLIANWIPFEEPAGGPNFYPFAEDAYYDINIDNDGDAKPDITYRWDFSSKYESKDTFLYTTGAVHRLSSPNLNFKQFYSLKRISGNGTVRTLVPHARVAPSNVGQASMPSYGKLSREAIRSFGGSRKTFAGQADDSFFLDLRVFDLIYGADLSETGNDTLSGYNVNSVALQVPKADLTAGSDPTVGIWSTTERPSIRMQGADGSQNYTGKYVQVSRLGNPLVNEVVVPVGLKDAFNALRPQDDASVPAVVNRVLHPEVPRLIEQLYQIPAPKKKRYDLFHTFLTGLADVNQPTGTVQPSEMLRLNTSTPPDANPNRLGLLAPGQKAGFPNGRRLTDDVVDIELQVLEGALRHGIVPQLAAGDRVDTNDVPFRQHFPYLALPHSGSDVRGGVLRRANAAPSSYQSGQVQQAPDRRHSAASADSAAATLDAGSSDQAPYGLIAVVLGLGFGGLGAFLLRRSRREAKLTS